MSLTMRYVVFGWLLLGLVVLLAGCASQGFRWVNDRGTTCYTRDVVCSQTGLLPNLPGTVGDMRLLK